MCRCATNHFKILSKTKVIIIPNSLSNLGLANSKGVKCDDDGLMKTEVSRGAYHHARYPRYKIRARDFF
jgi:hypothetical protein